MSSSEMLSALLIASSVMTIGSSSAVLGYYNGPVATPKDAKYNMQVVYMVLACLGVVIGLASLLYPKKLSYITENSTVSTLLVVVWLSVTLISGIQARQVIGEIATTFLVEWVIIAAIGLATLYTWWNYEE
jgi:hypothetical protein